MNLLGLVVCGIRKFKEIKKISFSPGLNIIYGENDSGKTTLYDAILSLLRGNSYKDPAAFISRLRPDISQAALIFKNNDETTYRIAKDFIKARVNLSRFDSSKKFNIIARSEEEAELFIKNDLSGLDGDKINSFFSLNRYNMPSSISLSAQKEEKLLQEDLILKNAGETSLIKDGNELHQKEERIRELKKIIEKINNVLHIEEETSDLNQTADDLKKRISIVENGIEKSNNTREGLRGYELFNNLSPDFHKSIDEYKRKKGIKDDDLQKIKEEIEMIKAEIDLISNKSIFKDKTFLSGISIILFSILSGLFITLEGIFQQVYLFSLLSGIGITILSIIKDIRISIKRKRMEDRIEERGKNKNDIEERFNRDNIEVVKCMEKSSSEDIQTLIEKIRRYNKLKEELKNCESEMERSSKGKSCDELKAEYESILTNINDLEEKKREIGITDIDIYGPQEELRILENEIRGYKESEGSISSPLDTFLEKEEIKNGNGDILSSFFTIRFDCKEIDDLIEVNMLKLQADINEMIGRFSSGKYYDISFDEDSHIIIYSKDSEGEIEIDSLSPSMLDKLFLAIFLATYSIISPKYSFPLIIDDPLVSLDSRSQQLAIEILNDIAIKNNSQIIISSTNDLQIKGCNYIKL
ncbi:MAG: ATP-binding protein [Nitrospirota bacterium]